MTLEEFSATGRDVADLGTEFEGMDLDGTAGRVYLYKGGAYIERWEDDRHGVAPPNGEPTWLLTLGRDQYQGDLATLEPLLFDWCKDEGFFEPRTGVVINEAEWAATCAMRDVTGHPADPRNSGAR
jgi:hypothetical protein